MQINDNSDLKQEYDCRYRSGYMESWPSWKKKRVKDLICKTITKKNGIALDFGCGSGVFTQIIKEALPDWIVTGVDISIVSIDMARERVKNCTFYTDEEFRNKTMKFDFIFSHHVLEHVLNIDETIDQLDKLANANCIMMHILPCGNKGSVPEIIASCVRGGKDPDLGNRMFFEDRGHLRCLTSDELSSKFESAGFSLQRVYFALLFFGVLEYFGRKDMNSIVKFTPIERAVNVSSKIKLVVYRYILLFNLFINYPDIVIDVKFRHNINLRRILKVFFFPFVMPGLFIKGLRSLEWMLRKRHRKGWEMYMVVSRPVL